MEALRRIGDWPVHRVAAAIIDPAGSVQTVGEVDHVFALASMTKPIVAWAILVAVEEGSVALDDAVGQPGCTLRHLLAHAGGYAFDGDAPIAAPGRRRIYSNTGIELAAAHVETATGMSIGDYTAQAVLQPLGMAAARLVRSPAQGMIASVADVITFIGELIQPSLIDLATASDACTAQFGDLAGVVPGFGSFDPCPWGLGVEIRGDKAPHWMGRRTSPATFGHYGGAGTLMWVDPDTHCAAVALTDRRFEDWADDARTLWPQFADAVIDEVAG